jgi:hypothetical protein
VARTVIRQVDIKPTPVVRAQSMSMYRLRALSSRRLMDFHSRITPTRRVVQGSTRTLPRTTPSGSPPTRNWRPTPRPPTRTRTTPRTATSPRTWLRRPAHAVRPRHELLNKDCWSPPRRATAPTRLWSAPRRAANWAARGQAPPWTPRTPARRTPPRSLRLRPPRLGPLTHAGLADPHTGYRLESADHTHASTGLQGGQIAYSATHRHASGRKGRVLVNARCGRYGGRRESAQPTRGRITSTPPARARPRRRRLATQPLPDRAPAAAMTDHKHAMPANPVRRHRPPLPLSARRRWAQADRRSGGPRARPRGHAPPARRRSETLPPSARRHGGDDSDHKHAMPAATRG